MPLHRDHGTKDAVSDRIAGALNEDVDVETVFPDNFVGW